MHFKVIMHVVEVLLYVRSVTQRVVSVCELFGSKAVVQRLSDTGLLTVKSLNGEHFY